MTAFAILGSSGQAYRRGIGIYGMMASSSCLVIPLTIFFIGTRLWALGKKFGHQTQVSFFRDRWECNHIGTAIFAPERRHARAVHDHQHHGRRHGAGRTSR